MVQLQLTAEQYRDMSFQTLKSKFIMFTVGFVVFIVLSIFIIKIIPPQPFHLVKDYFSQIAGLAHLPAPSLATNKISKKNPSPSITENGQISSIMSKRVLSQQTEYVVQEGDSLASIAEMMYGDSEAWVMIANANNLASPDLIEVGMKLKIPRK